MIATDPAQAQRLKDLRRLKELRQAYGIYCYRPQPKQELFHLAAKFKRRYLRTGNRFGKSTCGSAEDVSFALGARLWVKPSDPLYQLGIPKRSTKGLILVADWDKAREIFTNQEEGQAKGKLFQWIPKDRLVGVHKNQAGEIDCIEVKSIWGGTSSIYLDTVKSYMSNPMGQESSQWDWIHVDEPIPKAMWDANARGLMDTNGSAWFTCTPIKEQWINEYFLPPRQMKDSFDEGMNWAEDKVLKDRWVLTGSTYDNKTITVESIDRYYAELSPDERYARIWGQPKASAGLVYKEFDFDRHVYAELPKGWKDFDQPPDNYTIRVVIDTHPRTAHAVQFWASAPTGEKFCYLELFSQCMIGDLCKQILEVLNGRVPYQIAIEPAAYIESPMDGRCFADEFMDHGLNVEPAPKSLSAGIQLTKKELAKPNNLFFCSSCSETLREFYCYTWDDKKEKPVDKDDHMMECLYRACTIGLEWVDLSEEAYDLKNLRPLDSHLDLTPLRGGTLKAII